MKRGSSVRANGGGPFHFAGRENMGKRPRAPIHNRMPVIIPPERFGDWLNPELQDVAKLTELLKPFDAKQMTTFPISTKVNNPRNDVAECIAPLKGA